MKRILLLIAVALLLCLAACAPSQGSQPQTGNPPATIAPTIAPEMEPPMPSEPVIAEPTDPIPTEPATCRHDFSEATCNAAPTCTKCGVTEGEALGHDFAGGSCDSYPTCTRCGEKSAEKGEHNYYGGKCSACGATNERYEDIKAALKAAERYPKYIKINQDLIENEYDLFNLTKEAKYFTDAHEHTLEIHDYLQKIIKKCEDYKELDMLTDECRELVLEMPIVPGSATTSAMRSYISDAKSYARKAANVAIIYNVLCKNYDLPGV